MTKTKVNTCGRNDIPTTTATILPRNEKKITFNEEIPKLVSDKKVSAK